MKNPWKPPQVVKPKNSSDFDVETPVKQPSSNMTWLLFGLLAFWIVSIAAGTLLFGHVNDWRKPLLVMLPMGVFLTLWALLLRNKYLSSKRDQ